ncbi:MAG: acetyl-CoA carboxylase biotin carboxyl carrier protein [Clostridia bacterium]
MEIEKIASLAQILNEGGLTLLEVEEGNLRIRLEKNSTTIVTASPTVTQGAASSVNITSPVVAVAPVVETGKAILSPMVGVFYQAASPTSEPFVSVGKRVQKGDVLCIIEAMKLMNEITAEEEGTVTEICVENGVVVEFGTKLFRLSQV